MERYEYRIDEYAPDAQSNNPNQRTLRQAMDYIYENAMGTPIEFDAVPTLDSMKANTWGFFENDVYIKTASGSGIKITGSAFT